MQNLRILICQSCRDVPQENIRTIVLPPDPIPIENPRAEAFVSDNNPISGIGWDPTRFTYLLNTISNTNFVTESNLFSNAAWATTNCTVSSGAGISPDGTNDAWTFTRGSTASSFIENDTKYKPSVAGPYTFSIFGKPGTGNFLSMYMSASTPSSGGGFPAAVRVCFNVATGVVSASPLAQGGSSAPALTGLYATITPAANGFFRCSLSALLDGTSVARLGWNGRATSGFIDNSDTSSNATIIAFGAQVEFNSGPSVYQATSSTPATVIVPTPISVSQSVFFGTMTGSGGIDAPFRGAPNKVSNSAATLFPSLIGSSGNFVGINWSNSPGAPPNPSALSSYPAQGYAISQALVNAPVDMAFLGSSFSTTVELDGSNDGVTWAALATQATAGLVGESVTLTSASPNTSYGFHRVVVYGDGIHQAAIGYVELSANGPSIAQTGSELGA